MPVREVLSLCYQKSAVSLAFLHQGKVCAVAGVEAESLLGGRGCLWSWTSKKVKKIPKLFWKVSKSVLGYFLSVYPYLYVLCDERYLQARVEQHEQQLSRQDVKMDIVIDDVKTIKSILMQFRNNS